MNRFNPRMLAGISACAAYACCGTLSADILYDNTSITDDGTYTMIGGVWSYIGGLAVNPSPRDTQCADDFTLASDGVITRATADFVVTQSVGPAVVPATGVLVEFFQHDATANAPTNGVAYAQVFVPASSVTGTPFTHNGTGTAWHTGGIRLSADLGEGISLAAGQWWISIVAVDETSQGQTYSNVSKVSSIGTRAKRRDGGTWHGNNYGGHANPNWGNPAPGAARDLAIRVEGTLVPAPGGAALVVGAGVLACGRRRRLNARA